MQREVCVCNLPVCVMQEEGLTLELSRLSTYREIVEALARALNLGDPDLLRLTGHAAYGTSPAHGPHRCESMRLVWVACRGRGGQGTLWAVATSASCTHRACAASLSAACWSPDMHEGAKSMCALSHQSIELFGPMLQPGRS